MPRRKLDQASEQQLRILISELRENERILSRAIQRRDEFLSIASHELKTPLTTLMLQNQLRKRSVSEGDPDAFTLDKIQKMIEGDTKQVERLTRLIDDMLDIAQITSGKLTMNPEVFDLSELVREVLDRFSNQIEASASKVMFEQKENILGNWDRFRIEQVVVNLLTNAIKYGAGKPIRISIFAHKQKAILTFQDQGIGIAEKDQSRIFEQFERAVPQSETSGLGLGLYIVRQILRAHDGSICVESQLGYGSKFIVELPLGRR